HTRLQGDWSSDVCSSDLAVAVAALAARPGADVALLLFVDATWLACMLGARLVTVSTAGRSCASPGGACERSADSLSALNASIKQIGRASCRESVVIAVVE